MTHPPRNQSSMVAVVQTACAPCMWGIGGAGDRQACGAGESSSGGFQRTRLVFLAIRHRHR